MNKIMERARLPGLVQWAAIAAVAVSIALPILEIAKITLSAAPIAGNGLLALMATTCYLPLHLRHVVYAVRGARPPGARWTLTAMAIVILGAVPIIGIGWLSALHSLAVSALILLRPRWSVGIFAALVAAPIPLAFALGAPDYGPYYSITVAWRSLPPFVLIWLVVAMRQLEAARLSLTEEAVTQERLRIATEVRHTLGTKLEAIVDRAEQTNALVEQPPSSAELEDSLRILVGSSRRTLADVRRMVSGYQQISLRAELDTAAILLTAAGIETRVVLPAGDLPQTIDETQRSAFRSATADLLRQDVAQSCVIIVSVDDGQVRLEVRTQQRRQVMAEVTAR